MQFSRKFIAFLLLLIPLLGQVLYAQYLPSSANVTPACSTDGTANIMVTGGTPPYTYIWYDHNYVPIGNTSSSFVGEAGVYYVEIGDAGSGYGYTNVQIPGAFQIQTTTVNDQCNQGLGSATVAVTSGGTPPFAYLWNTGATTPSISGLLQGLYTATITDANGCYVSTGMDSSTSAYIWNTSPLWASITTAGSYCNDGTATVSSVSNGTPPYTYLWATNPVQTGQTATNLPAGNSTVSITDAMGCSANIWYGISQLPNGLIANGTVTNETCVQANGAINITVSGGQAPYSYQWSNGATTQNLSGLSRGAYSVTITDANNCPKVKSFFVQRTDPISLSTTINVQPGCWMNNGTISVTPTGGQPPYTYLWNNGATTSIVTNVGAGYYGVTVTDANGCYDQAYRQIITSSSCYSTISGSVSADPNLNCTYDAGDYPLAGRVVEISDGSVSYYRYTNNSGFYSINLAPGNYNVSHPYTGSLFALECPVTPYSLTTAASSNYPGNDFHDTTVVAINDLLIYFHNSLARPGMNATSYITVRNVGSQPIIADFDFVHDAIMTLQSAPGMASYNPGTRTANFGPIYTYPGSYHQFQMHFLVSTSATIGTSYTHTATVNPVTGDANPGDNVASRTNLITASFDPNQKSVFPEGEIEASQEWLYYMIEFQNTGNDTAFLVELRDQLDTDLQWPTIELMGASHAYTWGIDPTGDLFFRFENIMLPDSNVNEPASHGFVSYRIKPQPGLVNGTTINNTAAIYFDFNAPVITNTTINTVTGPTSISAGLGKNSFEMFPNPANERVMLRFDEQWSGETRVVVTDLSGRVLKSGTIDPVSGEAFTLNVSDLSAGLYLVKCSNASQSGLRKLVIE